MNARGMIVIALGLLFTAGIVHYFIVNIWDDNREIRMTDTERGVVYDFSASPHFYSFDARFFYFCTKDGMKYVSSNGDVVWQEPFTLTKPIIATHSEYIAVGEERGRRVFVFSTEGLAYGISFDHPVLTFSVNQTGHLAVILQLDSGYAVHIYSTRNYSAPLYSNIIHDPNIIPTSVSVSADGRFTAIALLDYGMRLVSRIMFGFVNTFDAWDTVGGIFAAVEFTDQIVYEVRFMDDNKALVFTDTQIICYQPGLGNALDERWTIPLHNRIGPLAFYGGSRFSFVTGDRFLNDAAAAEPGEVNIYDMNGELTGTFRLGRRATHLSMSHNHVLVGGDRSFYALNHRGTRIWDHTTIHDTRQFIFLDNIDTVLIAGGARASVMRRMRTRTEDFPEADFNL